MGSGRHRNRPTICLLAISLRATHAAAQGAYREYWGLPIAAGEYRSKEIEADAEHMRGLPEDSPG